MKTASKKGIGLCRLSNKRRTELCLHEVIGKREALIQETNHRQTKKQLSDKKRDLHPNRTQSGHRRSLLTLPLVSKWMCHLPTHQQETQSLECVLCEAFGEDVPELALGVDLDQGDSLARVSDVLAKPVVFYRVVLRSGGHATGLQLAEGECTDVVFVDLDVDFGAKVVSQSNCRAQLVDHINHRE